MKKLFFSLFFISSITFFLVGQSKSFKDANRKTAVRFLKLSQEYLGQKSYASAFSNAQMGINYDDSISDLWYISAASLHNQNRTKAEVFPLIEKAIVLNDWVDYNKEGARILYADLLCDLGEYARSISILDENPFIYSADAEYIRAKALYRQNTDSSLEKARNKINSARRIYTNDTRFPLLFFKYEYPKKKEGVSNLVQSIADAFIAKMPTYDRPNAELEIYAAIFSNGEARVRALKAFDAHNLEHPLYALFAMQEGLLTEGSALEYFFRFADKTISLKWLRDFAENITEPRTQVKFREHLASYHGLLTIDTDESLEPSIFVQYTRGRPSTISYDMQHNGVYDWSCTCDFGVPISVLLNGANLVYGTYPSVVKLESGSKTFFFSDESFSWTPFTLVPDKKLQEVLRSDFFVPSLQEKIKDLDHSQLHALATRYDVPTLERTAGHITFSLVDGVYKTAEYFEGTRLYARTIFENGVPVIRSVDNNRDGVFETTELYALDRDGSFSESNRNKTREIIYGSQDFNDNRAYTSAIHIDENGDSISDFIEEYTASGGTVMYWDTTGDGNWNIKYEKYAQRQNEALVELASFYTIPDKRLVTVSSYDGTPGKVMVDKVEYPVYRGKNRRLYWIGDIGSSSEEELVLRTLDSIGSQGISTLVQAGERRLLAVRVANNSYVSIINSSNEDASGEDASKSENVNKNSRLGDSLIEEIILQDDLRF